MLCKYGHIFITFNTCGENLILKIPFLVNLDEGPKFISAGGNLCRLVI